MTATLNRRGGLPFVALLALLCAFLITVYERLADTATDPQRAAAFVQNDSAHYVEMAKAFSEGQLLDPITVPCCTALWASCLLLASTILTLDLDRFKGGRSILASDF